MEGEFYLAPDRAERLADKKTVMIQRGPGCCGPGNLNCC